jgi:hypothetical protein
MVRNHCKKRGHTWVNGNLAHKKIVMANQLGQSKDGGSDQFETKLNLDNCDNPVRDNSVLSPKPLHLVIER